METDQFRGYADNTRSTWGRELRNAEAPTALGDIPIPDLTPAKVQAFPDTLADRPGKHVTMLRALKQIDAWAGLREKLPRQITLGCDVLGSKGGHIPWELHEMQLVQKFAAPHIARAVTLAYYTGQRCSDLVRMMFSDIEKDGEHTEIHVIQKKTGRELWVPFTNELKAALATWERRVPDNILLSSKGLPFSAKALGKAWTWERDNNPNLAPLAKRGLVMHGLRGGCCVYLSRKGLTDHQIGDMIGMSPLMVARYTRLSSQRKNARTALAILNKNK